ncbi:hypothetical protein FBU59_002177 [Linderina macrospora]|uniref:Uncharacterized protein n=1 Tax=Linderina macrospora TaxID=4868 RepID=A0ACC1JC41_9FUNG|nr:hypothetical protein FBU59_002177 [Linderina macrospora]
MPEVNQKKRPMGLKARAAKKQKTEEVSANGAQVVNDFDDEKTATIMLKNEGAGETNELDELEGIFDGALEAIEDPERAVVLLRGTIHECDRMLRVHDEESTDETPDLDPKFYYIYGSALFSISELAEPEDKRQFLELAKLRLEQVEVKGDEEFAWRVYSGLAKVALELSASDEEEEPKVDGALENFAKALELAGEEIKEQESLATVDLVLSLADSHRLSNEDSLKLIQWGETTLKGLPQDAAAVKQGQARVNWLRASELLEQQDEETGEVPEREAAVVLLTKAQNLLEGAEGDALLLLGEVQLNLGNVMEEEEAQEEMYKKAVETFKKAQQNGDLPEQFAQFIEDFEE